jgi:uncharacterized protein YjbI with pentapeptide repeats
MADTADPQPSKEDVVSKLKQGSAVWNAWWSALDYPVRRRIQVTDCDLSHLNLRGAILRDIDFAGTNFFETDLREADLRGADLSKAKGCLLARQFAGTDLTGAMVPNAIANVFEKLGSVNDISSSAKKLFLVLIAACSYSWLTIATTKDVDLITNRASSPLPIIQTAIPIVGFYIIAPIILLCIYFYFHFYLQKLWEELALLPAIFTDGRPLYVHGDPWLFNDLVRAHFLLLKKDRPFLSHLQQWISIILAWWVVPMTLAFFWVRYLPRHGSYGTTFHSAILAVAIIASARLYFLARFTLRGNPRSSLKQSLKNLWPYVTILIALAFAKTLVCVSKSAMNGQPWITKFIADVGYSPFANLSDTDISIKPPNWTGKKEQELDLIKGADISHQDLRYARVFNAFLAKAQLMETDLRGAAFNGADMRQANLQQANLQGALLWGVDLRGADLSAVKLQGAEMPGTDLTSADLTAADLTGLTFGKIFQHSSAVNITETATKLKYANLRFAKGIAPADIQSCDDWDMAFYSDEMLEKLGLPPDHNQKLIKYQESGSQETFESWRTKSRKIKAKIATRTK